MLKEIKGIQAIITVIFTVFGCGGEPAASRAPTAVSPPETGEVEETNGPQSVGNFTLKDTDGKPRVLSDYLGKQVVVLSFFATWCEPCRIELTELRDYYRDHQNAGFTVLAIAMDEPETQGDIRPFAQGRRLNFPVLLDTELEAVTLYNPKREAPFVVVIDKKPSIYWSHYGYLPGDGQRLQSVIEAAVEQRSRPSDDQ